MVACLKRVKCIHVTSIFILLIFVTSCMYIARPKQPSGSQARQPVLTQEFFISSDNYRHPYRTWLPGGQKIVAVIVGLHGFNDYSNAFDSTGKTLAQKGIAVYAYDQRGFGDTFNKGLWYGNNVMVQDLRTFIELVEVRHSDVPLYVLGDSMGGAIVLKANAMEPLRVEGAILVAPAVWGRAAMPWYQKVVLWLTANTVPWLKVSGKGLDIRASDNDEMLKKLSKDPLIIKESRIDTLWGLTDLMDDGLAASSQLKCPALVLYGKKDEIIPEKAIRIMIRRLPEDADGMIKIALYENGYHMLLRDLQAQIVSNDIESWVKNRSSGLPSKADMVTFN